MHLLTVNTEYSHLKTESIPESNYIFTITLTLLARALAFTWEGDRVAVLERGGAGGGGVGALAEGVDEDDGAGLLTLGLFSLSFSLPCEGLWL